LLSILAEGKEGKGRKTNFDLSLVHIFNASDSVHLIRVEFMKSHPLVLAFGGIRLVPLDADQRLLERISEQILHNIGKETGSEFVISTENGMDISHKAFMNLLECRGNMIGLECKDVAPMKWVEPKSELQILKPMRDVLPKEVMYFNHRKGLVSFPPLKLLRSPGKWTTSRRTELFLSNLQSNFPGTIHTVLRSLSHILPSDAITIATESVGTTVVPCSICHEPVIQQSSEHEEPSAVFCSSCQSIASEERHVISGVMNELHDILTFKGSGEEDTS
jgi:tRNA(Ile)-lysidine synthase TilS/MesJ